MAAPLNEFTRQTLISPPKRGLSRLQRFTYGLLMMAKLAGPLVVGVKDTAQDEKLARGKIANRSYSFCKEISSTVAQSW